MQSQHIVDSYAAETAAYFQVPGAHLYTVLHAVTDPIARVLLIGPFASERHYSYIPWVRWARYLARERIECLRYDYRGVGESTGIFEHMSFEHWIEDVELLAGWLGGRSPHVPLILHGLELGAVLAGENFQAGVGDALLLWAPPAGANQALRAALVRRVSMDHAFKLGDERKPLSDYIGRLEDGGVLDVEGYKWSRRLWCDSFKFELQLGISDGKDSFSASGRPTKVVQLGKRAVPLTKGSSVGYEALHRDFSELFSENVEWISNGLDVPHGGSGERSN